MSSEESNRFSSWFATTAFSVIALVAMTIDWEGDVGDQMKEVKWSFSAILVSLCLSGLALLAHVARDKFVGTPVEGGLVR